MPKIGVSLLTCILIDTILNFLKRFIRMPNRLIPIAASMVHQFKSISSPRPSARSIYLALICWLALTTLGETAWAQRTQITLNDNWRFLREDIEAASSPTFDDQKWERVNVPHSYNTNDAFDNVKGYYEGPAWYSKTFRISEVDPNKNYYIQFEGANKMADVWLNGNKLGQHQGGYTAFVFDITPFLKAGSNNLAVRVDNSTKLEIAPISADFTFYGGITRDVWLISTPKAHLGVLEPYQNSFWYRKFKVDSTKGQVEVEIPVFNQSSSASLKAELTVNLLDAKRQIKGSFKTGISLGANKDKIYKGLLSVAKPTLWSPSTPYLYTVEAILSSKDKTPIMLDHVQQPLGWRWFRFSADSGFFLNGQPLKLMGTNRHQDRANIGPELTDAMHIQDIEHLKEMGANFIRIAHYPQDPALLNACDRLGILAWEEIPIVNQINTTTAFTNSCLAQMSDMVNQHRNHPSIIIWGYMNEVLIKLPREDQDGYMAKVVGLAKKLDSLARSRDPERFTGMALHNSENYNKCGLPNVPQVVGWNFYHGWYHDTFEDFGKRMDKEHAQYPKRIHLIAEYGAGMDGRIFSSNPNIYDFTPQWGQAYHESYYRQIMDRPYIAGGALWNLVDFGSEGRKETMPHINNKGMLTMERRRKDVYYFYQAALTPAKNAVVYIAERDRPFRKVNIGQGWKYVRQPIKIYSNQGEVEIFVNDRSQGKVKLTNFSVKQDVVLLAGTNKVVVWAYDAVGGGKTSDTYDIEVELQPENLTNEVYPFKEVSINCGSNADFTDPLTNQVYEADKAYKPGSYGFIGGRTFMNFKRIGSQDEIIGTDKQPVFQTRRDSLSSYKFDVPAGHYEVELMWAETDPKAKSVVYDLAGLVQNATNATTERSIDVDINTLPFVRDLNLIRDYGFNQAVTKRANIMVTGKEGIEVKFKANKGLTTISGIRVQKL